MDQITPPLTCTLYGMPILNKIEVPRLIFYMSSKNMINILQDGPLLLATGFTGGRTPISGLLTLLLAAIGPILLKIYPNPRISVVLWEHVEKPFLMFTPIFGEISSLFCAMCFKRLGWTSIKNPRQLHSFKSLRRINFKFRKQAWMTFRWSNMYFKGSFNTPLEHTPSNLYR